MSDLVRSASVMKDPPKLSTGCKNIDDLLGGGLPTHGITEISGESGSGKSQLCKQLCLTVQYPMQYGGLGGGAVYICTEERFPSKRLAEMVKHFPTQFYKGNISNINFSDNIFIEHISEYSELEQSLASRVPVLIDHKNVKMVVIDSVAAVMRASYDKAEGHRRTLDLRMLGAMLHKQCAEKNVMIVCVNQVTNVPNCQMPVPALGLAWANLVTNRFQLLKLLDNSRQFSVSWSPELPPQQVAFKIESFGIGNA